MKRGTVAAITLGMAIVAGAAQAADLCKANFYTKAEAAEGKVLFDSHCALCHQYDMTGRQPGNFRNESPDINVLSASDLEFLDNSGGSVPPLIGAKFFGKMRVEKPSVAEFSAYVSSATNSFPPTGKVDTPYTYFKIAAYVLYRNCGAGFGSSRPVAPQR